MSRPGRKPIAIFADEETHINEKATEAANKGAYTVESICPGLCYLIYRDRVCIASGKGSMTVHMTTAEAIIEELAEILKDFKEREKNGMTVMGSKDIRKMLESDFI